jgi:hypothetical protein
MLNEFNTELSSRLRESRELTDAIGRHLTDARGAAGDNAAETIDGALSLNSRLREILHSFTLKNDR